MLPADVLTAACETAEGILAALDVVGVACVEFFVTRDGRVLVNEIAPRTHNSGHLTINAWQTAAVLLAVLLAWLPRFTNAVRFRQSLSSAVAQPVGIAVFLAIQWVALVRKLLGLRTSWRGRPLVPQ